MQFSAFKSSIRRIIQDDTPGEDGSFSIPDEDIVVYANFALDWISNRHPVRRRSALSVDTSRIVSRPAGALRIVGIFAGGKQLEEVFENLIPLPGQYSLISEDEIKIGTINGTSIDVLYDSSYDHVSVDGDEIPVSSVLLEACLYYAASRSLAQRAVNAGNIDQYNTRIDSGNPEDNPLLKLSQYYEKMAFSVASQRTLR